MNDATEQEPLLSRVLTETAIIAQLSRASLEAVLPDGLSAAGYGVLTHLVRRGDGWTPARLANAFQVTKGAMTNTLQRLEVAGLVRIAPDAEDGRVKRVMLAARGARVRLKVIEEIGVQRRQLVDSLPPDLLEELLPRLRALRAFLDAARD